MFDLDLLYKKYLYYKIKKFVPFFIFISGVIAVVIFTIFKFFIAEPPKAEMPHLPQAMQSKKPEKKVVQKRQSTKVHKQAKHYNFFTLSVREKNRDSIQRVQKKYAKLGLKCQIENQNNYLHLVCGQTNSYKEYQQIKNLLDKHHIKYYVVSNTKEPITDREAIPKKSVTTTPKETLKVKEHQEHTVKNKEIGKISHADADMELLQKKFAQHESYGIAIHIAKEYYSKKQYEKSLYWAKKANNLDRKKSQSWILYARSLYALGKQEKAKQVLNLYKRFTSSKEVDRILQGWENDK